MTEEVNHNLWRTSNERVVTDDDKVDVIWPSGTMWENHSADLLDWDDEFLYRKTVSTYDSTADTLAHIRKVNEYLIGFSALLLERAVEHDESKLHNPEKEAFDRETPNLRSLVYGTQEYKDSLAKLGVALNHHYEKNSHHPEHYEDGVDGMTLMDVVEMMADWVAAAQRGKDKRVNLEASFDRFKFSDQLANIFRNTYKELGVETVPYDEPEAS